MQSYATSAPQVPTENCYKGYPPPGPFGGEPTRPSAVVWHIGTKGSRPTGTAHHNLIFGGDWDDAFRVLKCIDIWPNYA